MFVSENEWRVAEYHLAGKPDGTVLPYSALLDPDTGKAIPRHKRPKLFNAYRLSNEGPAANTFHTFIKIDGEIFAIAQGKTPEAILGEGMSGKVKFLQNKKGELAAVKIETGNSLSQQGEARILKDRSLSDGTPLSRGKVTRVDKSKYYTHIAYLGVNFMKVLKNYQLQFCMIDPVYEDVKQGVLYLYIKNKQLYYLIRDEKTVRHLPLPDTLAHAPVIEEKMNYLFKDCISFSKNEFHSPENSYELILTPKEPSDEEIKEVRVYLYSGDKGLQYAFKESDGKITRRSATKTYPFISKALSNTLLDDPLKKSIYAAAGLYPRGGNFPLETNEDNRLQAAIDICLQVDSLHRGLKPNSRSGTPIAHQDLKPENIVMDANGHCHLIDFGFATTTPERDKTEFTGTPLYLPPLNSFLIFTQAEFDVVALKRILTMPSDLNCIAGKHTVGEEERRDRSVLTDEMVKNLNLAQYLDTSFKDGKSYTSVGTALTLAALLISAQLKLGIDYQMLQKSNDQCLLIVGYYKNRKNTEASTLKQNILEALNAEDLPIRAALADAGLGTPTHAAKHHPVAYLAIYLKKNAIPGKVDDIEKARVLIEAINTGFSRYTIRDLMTWETFQIKGRIRAKKLGFIDTDTDFLKQTKSNHPNILLGFAQTKTEAQRYLQFYHLLSELETKIPSLDTAHKQATSDLATHLSGAILELDGPQNNRVQQFKRFSSRIDTAISTSRAVLETNTGLTKFLDDLCTVLASLIIFYPIVYAYQKKKEVHYSFFKPQTATMLDEIQTARNSLSENFFAEEKAPTGLEDALTLGV